MVLQLAQERRIDLNQPVQRYLPGLLPASYPPVPVYTLLDHTSGLPSVDIPGLYDPEWILANRFTHWSPREVVDTAFQHPIDFQPGTARTTRATTRSCRTRPPAATSRWATTWST
jgi:D-alanyl-D-alanine carboxypeptidase